jgi:hypothetical protein
MRKPLVEPTARQLWSWLKVTKLRVLPNMMAGLPVCVSTARCVCMSEESLDGGGSMASDWRCCNPMRPEE